MAFCKKCGAEIPEGKAFCSKCGTPVEPVNVEEAVNEVKETVSEAADVAKETIEANKSYIPDAPKKPVLSPELKAKLPIICGAAVAAIVVVVLLIVFLGGGGYEGAIKKYFKSMEKADGKAYIELTLPKEIREDFIDAYGKNFGKSDDMEELTDYYTEYLEDRDISKVTYEIKTAENMDKIKKLKSESNYEDLDDFGIMLDKKLGKKTDFDSDKISEAWVCKVKTTSVIDGDKEKNTRIMYVYKYDGSWYVYDGLVLGVY